MSVSTLSEKYVRLLRFIDANGRATGGEVAKHLCCQKARASVKLCQLRDEGWVASHKVERRGRFTVQFFWLTEKSKALLLRSSVANSKPQHIDDLPVAEVT